MEKLYTVSKSKIETWLWIRSWTPFAKFRLKLKKEGKTTRPCRYDLNQIPYNCTVEMTNRFKGLDLIEQLKNYGWKFMALYKRHWSREEKEIQKGKMVVWEDLRNSYEKKRSKRQRRKERYTHLNAEFQTTARREKNTFFSDQSKEIEENNRMGKTRDLFKKIRDTKGAFHAKMGTIKDRNGMDLT